MKIYFATWPEEETQGKSLNMCNAIYRLISYYFAANASSPAKMVREYIKNGIVERRKNAS